MDHELTAWLGPAYDELTDEQRDVFAREAADIAERYPDPDDEPGHRQAERDAAMSAVVQYLLGETTPDDAARALRAARDAERRASIAAQHIALMSHRHGGVGKSAAAREAGIDRHSLLWVLGERGSWNPAADKRRRGEEG